MATLVFLLMVLPGLEHSGAVGILTSLGPEFRGHDTYLCIRRSGDTIPIFASAQLK
jgi:hypothetical protein